MRGSERLADGVLDERVGRTQGALGHGADVLERWQFDIGLLKTLNGGVGQHRNVAFALGKITAQPSFHLLLGRGASRARVEEAAHVGQNAAALAPIEGVDVRKGFVLPELLEDAQAKLAGHIDGLQMAVAQCPEGFEVQGSQIVLAPSTPAAREVPLATLEGADGGQAFLVEDVGQPRVDRLDAVHGAQRYGLIDDHRWSRDCPVSPPAPPGFPGSSLGRSVLWWQCCDDQAPAGRP